MKIAELFEGLKDMVSKQNGASNRTKLETKLEMVISALTAEPNISTGTATVKFDHAEIELGTVRAEHGSRTDFRDYVIGAELHALMEKAKPEIVHISHGDAIDKWGYLSYYIWFGENYELEDHIARELSHEMREFVKTKVGLG